ncbi:MAG: hypothetical protein FWG91_11350 [Lachnospiraceae bacterium]|nr:hypothetical protein [Lachnospiraceae bacterium]
MKKKNYLALFIIVVASLLLGLFGGNILNQYNQVYKVCYSEAGVIVNPADFFKKGGQEAFFTAESELFAIDVPGEYQIRLKKGWLSFKSTLIIEDTIPPAGSVAALNRLVGSELSPFDFVTEIIDATLVSLDFVELPDTSIPGRQEVKLRLTDLGGNQTILTAALFIAEIFDMVMIEAGDPLPSISDFVSDAEEAYFISDINLLDNTEVGEYPVILSIDGGIYETFFTIVDTIPPIFAIHDITSFSLHIRAAADFVTEYDDITPVTFHFLDEPDFTYLGTQEVKIIARDSGGNEAVESAFLTLLADTERPVIKGAVDFTVQAGDSVAYLKNAAAIDNDPIGLEFFVDQSAADPNTPGAYPVRYIARDFAGNETIVTITLTVIEKVYDIEDIYLRADEILERIFTDEMTEREKLWAIYRYNANNIFFEAVWEKVTWLQAAYDGLFNRRGDCYVYAMTAKVLLDRAGIKNEDIEKIVTSSRHYWHLVDLGDGWHHFDTTPRSDKAVIFMWTTAQINELMEETRYRSHRYDPDIFPRDRREIR